MFCVVGARNENTYVRIADIVIEGEYLNITCFVKTGNLFVNGQHALSNKSIRETLEWYMGESMDKYEIKELFFQNGTNLPRHAYAWELKTFYYSHWRYYAKNDIKISAVLQTNFFMADD